MSQEQQDYSHLADQIRGVKPQEPEAAGAHAGSEHVPEDVRERPVEGASIPIDPTVDPEDIPIPDSPAHVDMLPEERTHERIVALQPSPEPVVEQPAKKSRRGLIGGLAGIVAVATLGGVLYMTNKGGDHSSEATDPNTTPTPTATSGPSQPEQSATTQPESPSSNVLDPSIKPIEHSGLLDETTKYDTLQDHVSYNSAIRLVNPAAVNRLRGSSDPNVQQFMQTYVPDTYPNYSMSLLTAKSDVVDQLYDTVVWQSKFYGQPQTFQNPDTYKDIGSLPYATHQDIEDAYSNGDSTELFQKLYNVRSDFSNNALLDELKAGNVSPALASDLATWIASAYVSADGSKAQDIETVAQEYQQIIQQYKNPEQFEALLPTTTSAKIVEANVLSVSRQQFGVEFTSDNQQQVKKDGVTTMAIELKTAIKSPGDTTPTVQDSLYVGALVPVPDGSAGNGEHLQFIALSRGISAS